MSDSTINLIWVILFRTAQTLLDAAPTLLCGLFVAGLMRGMIGPITLRQWFTTDYRVGPVRAWFIGLILPVCSFGILPIAWELKRAGVPRACVLTLLFSAPLANPFSLIYAFQRLEGTGPLGLAAFAFLLLGSFGITVGLGVFLGRFLPEERTLKDLPPVPASAPRRVGVVALTMVRALVGDLLPFLVIGAFGSGLLAAVPGGALERALNDRSITSPLHVACVSIPFQTPAMRGTVLVCESLTSGVSVGRIFVFFLLGIGLHLGTLTWIGWTYGLRLFFCTVPLVIVCSLAVGFAAPFSIPTSAPDASRDCHFLEIESSGGYKVAKARLIRTTLTNDAGEVQWFMVATCAVLAGFWLTGVASTFLGERGSLTHLMTRGEVRPVARQSSVWSAPISRHHQAIAGVAVVLIFVLGGLYIYYPAPHELLNQMDEVQTELALALKSEPVPIRRAIHLASQWKRLQNKLVVSDFLRRGTIDSSVKASSTRLSTSIDRLRSSITSGSSPAELKPLLIETQQAINGCREVIEQGRRNKVAK